MSDVKIDDGIAEGFNFGLLVDEHAIQALLDVVDDVRILNVCNLRIAIEGLESRQDLFCLVGEVDDVGLVLTGVGAVQARQCLHRLDARDFLVQVHGHQLGLVEASLILVGDDHHPVVRCVEHLAHVAAMQARIEVGFAELVIGWQARLLHILVWRLAGERHHRLHVVVALALAVVLQRQVVFHRGRAGAGDHHGLGLASEEVRHVLAEVLDDQLDLLPHVHRIQ
ncbi:hypothetical protein D3C76_781170 [compost metagenome]